MQPMTRAEKQARLAEVKEEITLARKAMKDIASGKKQSYGIGTRQAAAYAMSLSELRAWLKELRDEESALAADLANSPRRAGYVFQPRY